MEADTGDSSGILQRTAILSARLPGQLHGWVPSFHRSGLRLIEPIFENGSGGLARGTGAVAVSGIECLRTGGFKKRGGVFSQSGDPDGRGRIAYELSDTARIRKFGQNTCSLGPRGRE